MNRRWMLLGGVLLLAGCAGIDRPRGAAPADVFHDHLFSLSVGTPDASRLFALTPAMQQFLRERIEPQLRRKSAQRALIDALYTEGELRLEYDATFTRNAEQAFVARRGNCLSLVIMTAAFAQQMGLQVHFQEVLDAPAIEDSGALTFVIGHVNLALGLEQAPTRQNLSGERSWLVVDFLPGQDLHRQRTRPLSEPRVRAMYMNNRAVEELAQGRLAEAYGWVRGAWAQDPGFANLYNTLGVIYRHHGALAEAEQALQAARALDPDNEHVAGNLAVLQKARSGDPADTALAARRPAVNSRLSAAQQALEEGRKQQALVLLQGELALTPRNPELHHWLALTHAQLGNRAHVQRHLELAAGYSAGEQQRTMYAGKLERLKAAALRVN